jgi:nucleotide-binding universal stress UspA family protein
LPEINVIVEHERAVVALGKIERDLHMLIGDACPNIKLVANELPLLLGIERLVEQWHAGLVVAGSTGKSNMEQVLVGSNTVSMASAIGVPLLIVPKDAEYESMQNIVFACDLKKVSRSTPVSDIGFWLEHLEAKLLVLNVALEGKRFDPDMIPEQYRMHELLDGFGPEYHYTESEDIAVGIEDFAAAHGAGLVISIPKSHGFFEGLFHRSVSKKLIKGADIPLLLLRDKGE